MAGTGGARPGAGRKPGQLSKSNAQIKEILDKRVDWNNIVDKLIELVNGVEVQKFGPNGVPVIYSEKPDTGAAKILLEYGFGKPHQSISHSGEITEIIISKKIVK